MKRVLPLMIALLFAFVGMVEAQKVINFETGDFSQLNNYSLQNDSEFPWQVVAKDSRPDLYCMQSGNAGWESSASTISFSVNFREHGYISFDANCMGEGTYFDVCEFLIDGVLQFSYGANMVGWHVYGYNLDSGTHQFTWRYSKDSSVDPEGDCFQVDNIEFGSGSICLPPDDIQVYSSIDNTYLEWNGNAESYTLRYKKNSGSWTTIRDLTQQYYILDGLEKGRYVVEVRADCDHNNWVSTTFVVYSPAYWNDWYGFSRSSENPEHEYRFVHFKFEDVTNVTAVSENLYSYDYDEIYTAAFVKGYVWYTRRNEYDDSFRLYKAPVDMWAKRIGTPELVSPTFDEVQTMSFNPEDEMIYYVDNVGWLKKFSPESPDDVFTWGAASYVQALAINKQGQAFVEKYDDETGGYSLYEVNLSDGSMTKVGKMNYVSDMAFDMQMGELVGVNGAELYFIDLSSASTCYLGILGGDSYCRTSGLFTTYSWNAIDENTVENVNVYPNPAQGSFTVEGTGKLTITNLLGQEMLVREINGKTKVELSQGMYLVRLNDAVSKVVIE